MQKNNEQKPVEPGYVVFTEEMKKEYTLLLPTMLPFHFKMISKILHAYGYNTVVLDNMDDEVRENGLKFVHNDTCYPALLVVGQLISAVESGKYDRNKIALMMSQTGGGCRASNYIHLLRKAVAKAGYGDIPVVSFNLAGLESDSAFKITIPMLYRFIFAVFYGDILMNLGNQCRPYEVNKGEVDALIEKWSDKLADELYEKVPTVKKAKKVFIEVTRDFANIELNRVPKVKVGIVGEIFVKFSPLGNNNLEKFLLDEGAEVVMPGLMDFVLFFCYNHMNDNKLYGTRKGMAIAASILYKIILGVQRDLINAIKENSDFEPPTAFPRIKELAENIIGLGVKMGEGWLLPAEMLELADMGTKNIVCAQPFGCLPNHIVGKGMMKPIKEFCPDVNIVAIDYDAAATKINQENRIKLMLANAKSMMTEEAK